MILDCVSRFGFCASLSARLCSDTEKFRVKDFLFPGHMGFEMR